MVHLYPTKQQRIIPPTLHECPNVTLHGRHAVATYGAEVAIPDGQVVLRLLLILQHNHTRAAHMDNEASCRK